MFACPNCDFKCEESQLAKTKGRCPKCKKGMKSMIEKYDQVLLD